MIQRFLPEELLDYWKRRLGIAEASGVCKVVRRDAAALDAKLADDLQLWYSALLEEADPRLLPVDDLADLANAEYIDDSCVRVRLPDRGIRLVSVEMRGWDVPLTRFVSPNCRLGRAQANPLTRNGRAEPVGVLFNRELRLYGVLPRHELPHQTSTPLSGLYMVCRPTDGSFVFDDSLLRKAHLLVH